jgi:ribosome-associated translation inhibitor RaiA
VLFRSLQEESYEDEIFEAEEDDEISEDLTKLKFRIAIILKDGENSIEAEAFDNDIFNAIRIAKEALIKKLVEIQEEVESPQDRMMAIQLASENKPIH